MAVGIAHTVIIKIDQGSSLVSKHERNVVILRHMTSKTDVKLVPSDLCSYAVARYKTLCKFMLD